MKTLPKWVLVLAVVNLIVGIFVTMSHKDMASVWYLALPLGVIFTGLFLIALALQNEVVKFDEDERLKLASAKRHEFSTKGKEESPNAPDGTKSMEMKSPPPHQMSAEGMWMRGVTKKIHANA
ncbi:MAG: hypothetical protein ACREFE_13580 [Limisphaerales bacterium]